MSEVLIKLSNQLSVDMSDPAKQDYVGQISDSAVRNGFTFAQSFTGEYSVDLITDVIGTEFPKLSPEVYKPDLASYLTASEDRGVDCDPKLKKNVYTEEEISFLKACLANQKLKPHTQK